MKTLTTQNMTDNLLAKIIHSRRFSIFFSMSVPGTPTKPPV